MDPAGAIADPVRREVLVMLRDGELSAGEIAAAFQISRPAISRHLRVLRESGLVSDHQEGRQRRYRLTPGPLLELAAWLEDFRPQVGWQERLDALETEVYRTRRERRTRASSDKEETA